MHPCQVRVGVVGNISACDADAPGSIPGHGEFIFSPICGPFVGFFFISLSAALTRSMARNLNDTLPEWLSGSPAK